MSLKESARGKRKRERRREERRRARNNNTTRWRSDNLSRQFTSLLFITALFSTLHPHSQWVPFSHVKLICFIFTSCLEYALGRNLQRTMEWFFRGSTFTAPRIFHCNLNMWRRGHFLRVSNRLPEFPTFKLWIGSTPSPFSRIYMQVIQRRCFCWKTHRPLRLLKKGISLFLLKKRNSQLQSQIHKHKVNWVLISLLQVTKLKSRIAMVACLSQQGPTVTSTKAARSGFLVGSTPNCTSLNMAKDCSLRSMC